MINKIIFYTTGHNGDIHYSREFIKDIIKKIPNVLFEYHHNASAKLLKDISSLSINSFNLWDIYKNNFYYDPNTQIFYINTWIGCDYSQDGIGRHGCCLKSNYYMYNKIFDALGIKIENENYYIPSIQWNSYDISKIDDFFKLKIYKEYCLISNGNVLSGQAENINLNDIIKNLAIKFKNTGFLFELLTRQITMEILNNAPEEKAKKIVQEFFGGKTELAKELFSDASSHKKILNIDKNNILIYKNIPLTKENRESKIKKLQNQKDNELKQKELSKKIREAKLKKQREIELYGEPEEIYEYDEYDSMYHS